MNKINGLPPFKRFCVTIGNLPSSYVDSMSYYECLMWLCKYLKDTVIPAVNENAEAVNELINWFNTLDVQDEIDHKLDEMVESGELQEIISEYLDSTAIFGFDTVADMIVATNLIDGSYARTCGKDTYNDGNGALYKIRTVTNDDVVDNDHIIEMETSDTLIAEKIIQNDKPMKMILIGDSYGVERFADGSPITKFYWEYLIDGLGLTENTNFYNGCVSGASFGNGAYLTSITSIYNSLNNPEDITDIFICGGYNDSVTSFTEEYIVGKMSDFNDYVKLHFPHAKVTIAHIGYSNPILHTEVPSNYDVTNIQKSISAYKKGASNNGWYYINGIEYVLKNYLSTYWQTDGVHPSQLGQDVIGKYIINGFLTKNVNIQEQSSFNGIEPSFSSNVLAHSSNFKFINTLNDKISEVTMSQYNQVNYIRINDSATFNGADNIEIGTLNLPYVYGYNVKSSVSIPVIVNNGTNTMPGTAQLNIVGNKLYMKILAYDSATSSWRVNSSDYVYFYNPKWNIEIPFA